MQQHRRSPRDGVVLMLKSGQKLVAQQGMILVMTLLLLMIINMVIIAALQSSWFEIKNAQYFYHFTVAFENAESGLILAEHNLIRSPLPSIELSGKLHYQIIADPNQQDFFTVKSSGAYQDTTVNLIAHYRLIKEKLYRIDQSSELQ